MKKPLSVSQREVFGHLPAGCPASPKADLESICEDIKNSLKPFFNNLLSVYKGFDFNCQAPVFVFLY
jgi:hypothetical protein